MPKTGHAPLRLLRLCFCLGFLLFMSRFARAAGNPSKIALSVSGAYHTVALKADGTAWTCGLNSAGQLGNGTTTNTSKLAAVPGLSGVLDIAAGYEHTLAVKSDGTVWVWGLNDHSQLGLGNTTSQSAPVQVAGLSNVVAVAAGYYYSMALKSDGTVWTWGYNNYGQLGISSTASQTTPVQVTGLSGVVGIAAGYYHAVAVKSDGTLWSWGCNTYGELGNNTTVNKSTPAQVLGLSGVTAAAAGAYHTVALKSDGTVWTCGVNGDGELGDGTTNTALTPIQVAGLTGAVSVGAGYSHSLAVLSDGTLRTWGGNNHGQLGNGTNNDIANAWQVTGLTGVVAACAGYYDTVALTASGTIYTWGYNTFGDLGDRSTSATSAPAPVSGTFIARTLAARSPMALGGFHGLAVQSGGTVGAWGDNAYGQLGDGTTTSQANFETIPGLSAVTSVAAGQYHSLALKSDGTVWAWGYNSAAQVGDGTQATRLTPVQVLGAGGTGYLTNVTAVAAGSYYSLAQESDGTVWAWGFNGDGELGTGSGVFFSLTPVQVPGGLTAVKALFAGNRHALALQSDGTLWAWGKNDQGQLGNSSTSNSLMPKQVLGVGFGLPLRGLADSSSAPNSDFSLALAADGGVWTWGKAVQGPLGGNVSTSAPGWMFTNYPTFGPLSATSLSAGNTFIFARSDNGNLQGWGRNVEGELATGSTAEQDGPALAGQGLPSGTILTAIAAGNEEAMGLTSTGALLCWGSENLAALALGPDTDGDGMPDAWEVAHSLNPFDPSDAGLDPDGDGFTNLQEYRQGTDPHDYYNGVMPVVTILGGNNQSGQPGGFVANPLSVSVQNAAGQPYVGAAVTFAAGAGGGQLQGAASNQSAASVGVRTDATGQALAYFQLPNNPGGTSQITATAGSAGQLAQATFTATAFDTTGGGSSPYGPTDVVANYYPDGSADITWTSTAAPDDTTLVPLQERDINGNWTTLAMVAANSSSYHVDAAAAPPAPAPPNTPAASRPVQRSQDVLPVQAYAAIDISASTTSDLIWQMALDDNDNASFLYWDGAKRYTGLWSNGAPVAGSPKETASTVLTKDFIVSSTLIQVPLNILQGYPTFLDVNGDIAFTNSFGDLLHQTGNVHPIELVCPYGLSQGTDQWDEKSFQDAGFEDLEDSFAFLNGGQLYGNGFHHADGSLYPLGTQYATGILTAGGPPRLLDLFGDYPNGYPYIPIAVFYNAISSHGTLVVTHTTYNIDDGCYLAGGTSLIARLDLSSEGSFKVYAVNDTNDIMGTDSAGAFLIEQAHPAPPPPTPPAPTTPVAYAPPNVSPREYFAALIPPDLQSKIRHIYPRKLSNRMVTTGTAVQPVLSILFGAETLRTESPTPYWQATTFLLRKFSDGSTDLHEAGVPANAALVSINSSGVIAALGDPSGGGLWHALLLAPVFADSSVATKQPKYRGSVANPIVCTNQHTNQPAEQVEGALAIYHNEIQDSYGQAKDFDVTLNVGLPAGTNLLWSQISGPNSGTLLQTTSPMAIFRNPKEGGLYEFELNVNGQVAAKLQVWLLVAGPDISTYWQSEINYFTQVWGPAYQAKLTNETSLFSFDPLLQADIENGIATNDILKLGPNLEWTGDVEGAKTRCTTPIPVVANPQNQVYARYTMYGYTISYPKRDNMMFALIGREMGISEDMVELGAIIFNLTHSEGLTQATGASLSAGFDLYAGTPLSLVMVNRGLAMHEPNSAEDKEWPSYEVSSQSLMRGAAQQLQSLIQ